MATAAPLILLVDDDLTNRMVLKNILEKNGYRTFSATGGAEGIAMCLSLTPDLLLLDIMMPETDGYTVCRRLRGNDATRRIPIIFITAATDDKTLELAFEAGGNDFIRKPVNRTELLSRVNSAFLQVEMIQAIESKEKLEGALTMSRTVCHELNQPLQYVSGMMQLLLLDLKEGTPAHERVVKMAGQVDRMGTITKKLMGISRVDARTYINDVTILR